MDEAEHEQVECSGKQRVTKTRERVDDDVE